MPVKKRKLSSSNAKKDDPKPQNVCAYTDSLFDEKIEILSDLLQKSPDKFQKVLLSGPVRDQRNRLRQVICCILGSSFEVTRQLYKELKKVSTASDEVNLIKFNLNKLLQDGSGFFDDRINFDFGKISGT